MVFLQVSPFWGWSTPQVTDPEAPGFTRVTTEARGVELVPRIHDQQLLGLEVRERALKAGERIRFEYGAGMAGARVDRFAERGSRFWIAVDGDGDGVRRVVSDSPSIEVLPGPPESLVVTLPSVLRPGERGHLTVAVLDGVGNAASTLGEVTLSGADGLDLPERVRLEPEDDGRKTLAFAARETGTYRIRAEGPNGLEAHSNPLIVSPHEQRVFWGDLHGHSNLSDGTGTPEDYFRYARDVAALDVVALTDHDHWGILFLDQHPELWEEIRTQTRRFHEPGRFITLLGYEWTSWIHGHRHVLYFTDEGEVLSSADSRYGTPSDLWRALGDRSALSFAHHSAGGPIATNWSIPPDPLHEPVTEIVSVHGSSEAEDSPARIYEAVSGNYVRDVLDRGYRLGFIGSGDSHDGHPGLAHRASRTGGLAAILAEELTREGILAALRARRVYATNGVRLLLNFSLAGEPMGSTLRIEGDELPRATLRALAIGMAPITRLDIVRSGRVVESIPVESLLKVTLERDVSSLRAGEYVYLRVVQVDGGVAWSSPVYLEEAPG
jgi:hypothetical protein